MQINLPLKFTKNIHDIHVYIAKNIHVYSVYFIKSQKNISEKYLTLFITNENLRMHFFPNVLKQLYSLNIKKQARLE